MKRIFFFVLCFVVFGFTFSYAEQYDNVCSEICQSTDNDNRLLRIIYKTTQRKNRYRHNIRVIPISAILIKEFEDGSYSAVIRYNCVYMNEFERGIVENEIVIHGFLKETIFGFYQSGLEKMYIDCERLSPMDRRFR